MPMEIFTQPCAEQRKSLVEQTEEITVESLLESNDIQPLGNKLRFLVASLKRELLLLEVTLSFFVGRAKDWVLKSLALCPRFDSWWHH